MISVNNHQFKIALNWYQLCVACEKRVFISIVSLAFFGVLWIFCISQACLSCESKSLILPCLLSLPCQFAAGLWVRVWCRRSEYVSNMPVWSFSACTIFTSRCLMGWSMTSRHGSSKAIRAPNCMSPMHGERWSWRSSVMLSVHFVRLRQTSSDFVRLRQTSAL